VEGIEARTLIADPRARPVIPRVYIDFQEGFTLSSREVRDRMLAGNPPVMIGEMERGIRVDVMMLEEWQLRYVARRLKEVLSQAG